MAQGRHRGPTHITCLFVTPSKISIFGIFPISFTSPCGRVDSVAASSPVLYNTIRLSASLLVFALNRGDGTNAVSSFAITPTPQIFNTAPYRFPYLQPTVDHQQPHNLMTFQPTSYHTTSIKVITR